MKKNSIYLFGLVVILSGCSSLKSGRVKTEDGKLSVVFVQVNDVYEIAPLAAGKWGGMARVSTLKKQYLKKNPNTYLVMAGDFLSPSVFNSLQYEGQRIRGRQMVDAMNSAGMDFVIFGNHEFDLTESELQQRIDESNFQWISSNAFHVLGDKVIPFAKKSGRLAEFPAAHILSLRDNDGTTARIGLIGLVLPFNKAAYVTYSDALTTAKELYNQIKDSCDAVVAITHQLIADDKKLAEELPGLAVILGGHEHDMRFEKVGNTFVTKAHANARSAYIVTIDIDKKKKLVTVKPELKELDQTTPLDPATDSVVKKWIRIADENYASLGFDPKQIVMSSGEPLDGRETLVRTQSTNLTRLITQSMAFACPQAAVVIVNAGSIRVDDILYPPITQYDILRTMPFGGSIREVEMKGRLLVKVLETGRKNAGIGGYLHYQPIRFDSTVKNWILKDVPVDPDKNYRVAMSDFLLTGKEANLEFLNEKNPDIVKVYPAVTSIDDSRSDLRLAIIKYLQKK